MTHNIAVTLLTYNRMEYATETIRSLRENMKTSYPRYLHIADDGTPDKDSLYKLSATENNTGYWQKVTITNVERRGYGASFNASTMVTHLLADIHIPLEDDWRCEFAFDIDPLIAALDEANGEYDCIRMGYLSWTQELRCKLVRLYGQAFLALDPNSEEPHVFSGHPRIETTARQRRVGLWPLGLPAGATEWEVAHRPEARTGVLWPVDMIHPIGNLFGHFGAISYNNLELSGG